MPATRLPGPRVASTCIDTALARLTVPPPALRRHACRGVDAVREADEPDDERDDRDQQRRQQQRLERAAQESRRRAPSVLGLLGLVARDDAAPAQVEPIDPTV